MELAGAVVKGAGAVVSGVARRLSGSQEEPQTDADQQRAPKQQRKEEAAKKETIDVSEEPPKEQRAPRRTKEVEVSAQTIQRWKKLTGVAHSWVDTFGPPVSTFQAAAEHLEVVRSFEDGRPYDMEESQAKAFAASAKQIVEACKELRSVVAHNAKRLLPAAAEATSRAAELLEANEALAAKSNALEEAASETATKLQATQVALHQSSSGHSNIGSAFPLTIEIAEKVKAFSSSDAHGALVLEHLLGKFDTVDQLAVAVRALHVFCQAAVIHSYQKRTAGIMAALSNVEQTPLIDGFLRQIWQQHHATYMPTDDVSNLLHHFLTYEDTAPSLPAWKALYDAKDTFACVEQVMKDLLQLYIFTTVCDPPMKFDSAAVGSKVKFDPESASSMDDKIKPGKPSYVICPALYSADGMLKAKAQVLAADYL
tara:strand:- start:471 stop:1748 length:1278 start_codon:yes stop_codon:yes gene_type:complete